MRLDLPWSDLDNHLDKIRCGAQMCAGHTEQLMARPAYETLAEADLERCEIVLIEALRAVIGARAIYSAKKVAP